MHIELFWEVKSLAPLFLKGIEGNFFRKAYFAVDFNVLKLLYFDTVFIFRTLSFMRFM